MAFGTHADAQTAHFSGAQIALASGFNEICGAAVDKNGNVFVADQGNNAVKEILAVNGVIPVSPTIKTLGSGFSSPTGVAVDGSGNVFVADDDNGLVKEITAASGYTAVNTLAVANGNFSYPFGMAVDGSGNVFVADYLHNAVKEIVATGGYTTINSLGSGFNGPGGVAVDGSGNVFVAEEGGNKVDEIMTSAVNVGSAAIASSTPVTVLFTFTFDTAGTIEAPAVLTQGAANLDFKDTGNGTCTTNGTGHTYNPGDTCIVDVTFTPKYAGTRNGAVELLDASGNVLATSYISGAGIGPQIAFSPATQNSYAAGSLNYPTGAAVDGAGNIFVADTSNNAVKEIVKQSGAVISLGSGFNNPYGVAVDAAGNVFVADSNNNEVKEIVAAGGYKTVIPLASGSFWWPSGVAVDGAGNLYVAEYNSGTVKEITAASGYSSVTTLNSSTMHVYGIAVDADRNVFVAEASNGDVKEITSASGYTSINTLAQSHGPFGTLMGLALDGNGNVYITEYYGSKVYEIAAAGGYNNVSDLGSFIGPFGVAVDGAGNVFVNATSMDSVYKLDYADAPNLNFPTPTLVNTIDTDGSLSVTVQNIGNAPLIFSSGTFATVDFAQTSGTGSLVDCVGTGTVDAGASCNLSIEFEPVQNAHGQPTALNEGISLEDNNLNVVSEQQVIGVHGTSTAPLPADTTATSVTFSSASLTSGQTVTITATVTDTLNSGTTPTGNVTFTDTVGSTTTNLNGGAPVSLALSLATLPNVTLSGTGMHTITATYSDGTGGATFQSSIGSGIATVNPSSNVGTAAAAYPVTVTLSTGGNVSSISVVTQGATGLDFTDAGGDTCLGSHNAGDTCTVNVLFTPQSPGTRLGAVLLENGSNNVLGKAYLFGTGFGPEVAFLPGSQSTVGSGMSQPQGVTVDGNGNVFVANTNGGNVLKVPWTGSSYGAPETIISNLRSPGGVAVDGAGNVYVADYWNNRVLMAPWNGSAYGMPVNVGNGLNNPNSVAVDGSGNVYIADESNSRVVKVPWTGGGFGTQTTISDSNGSYMPTGVAVDGSGNVYVAHYYEDTVDKLPWNGSTYGAAISLGSDLSGPFNVAVDANGNVYIADSSNSRVVEEQWTGSGYGAQLTVANAATNGLSMTTGVSVDARGNVYIADQGNSYIVKLSDATVGSLDFPAVLAGSSSAASITVQNVGNAPLTLSVPSSGTNPSINSTTANIFTYDSSSTCPLVDQGGSAGTLAAGATCTYVVDFAPTVTEPYTGSLNLTDNSLTASATTYTTQNVSLTGMATAPPVDSTGTTVSINSGSLISGQTANITATVTDTNDTGVTPAGGTVAFTDSVNGGSAVALSGSPVTLSSGQANLSIALSDVGTHAITATYSGATGFFAGSSNTGTVTVGLSSNVETSTSSSPVTVTFTAAGTVGSINVLTQGATGLDFKDAVTGDTCSGPHNIGDTCIVNVTFTPLFAGSRYGAVVLTDGSGNVLANTYIQGTGTGPQVTFANTSAPGVFLPSAQTSLGSGSFSYPGGTAVDGAGNIFVADSYNQAVYKIAAADGSVSQLGGGFPFSQPQSVALDGAGNIFVTNADYSYPGVFEILAAGGYTNVVQLAQDYTSNGNFGTPWGVAVDGSGNIFVTDDGYSAVDEIVAAGGYTTVNQLAIDWSNNSGFYNPQGVAVDGSGNVFVADAGYPAVYEIPVAGGYTAVTQLAMDWSNNNGFSYPTSVAVDGGGNVYVADSDNSAVYEIAVADGYNTVNTLGTGFYSPNGVAVDGSGNVFVADAGNPAVVTKLNFSAPPAFTFAATAIGSESADSPLTLAVSNIGTASLTFSALSYPADFKQDSTGPAVCAASTPLAAGSSCMLPIDFMPQTAGPYTEALQLTDNATPGIQNIPLIGTSGAPLPDSTTTTVVITPSLPTIGQAVAITATVTDTTLNSMASSGSVNFVDLVGSTITQLNGGTPVDLVSGVATLPNVTLSGTGTHSIAAIYSGVSGVAESYGFASVTENLTSNVGAMTLSSYPVTLTFTSPGTPATVNVLTQGAPNLDFIDATTGDTCTGSYNIGDTCTVNVTFTPQFAGPRYGAVVVLDSDGNMLATTYISAVGTAPQIAFGAGTATATAIAPTANGVALKGPTGIAMDGAGGLYIADIDNNRVVQMSADGSTVTSIAPTADDANGRALNNPAGLALDGAGNLYIADVYNWRVLEVPANGKGVTEILPTVTGATPPLDTLNNPTGIAVDGAGNLFISDTWNNRVVEILANGGPAMAVAVNGLSLSYPSGLAVDSVGNLFISDTLNNRVVEVPAGGGAATVLAPTVNNLILNRPSGIVVDGAGNLFIADTLNNRVVEVPADGSAATAFAPTVNGVALLHPNGLLLNGAGDLFVSDHGNSRVVEIQRSLAPVLNYSSTAIGVKSSDSPQMVTVENAGNEPLSFSGLSVATDFPLDSAGAGICTSSTSLATGARCTLPIDFTPATIGAKSESVTLNDNSLNGSVAQNIQLSGGSATQGTSTVTLGGSPSPNSNVNDSVTLTATVTGSAATPTGTVTLTLNGGSVPGCSSPITLNGAGVAQCLTSLLPAGNDDLVATYNGDGSYNTSVSSTLPQAVSALPATISVSASPSSSTTVNTTVTFAAQLAGVALTPVLPAGMVTFTINGKASPDCPAVPVNAAGKATCITSSLVAGSATINASYAGDSNYTVAAAGSAAQTVSALAATLGVTASPSSNTMVNDSVTFTAQLAGASFTPNVPAGKVNFSASGSTIAGCGAVPVNAAGKATCTASSLAAGTDPITATYSGDSNFTVAAPASATQTVTATTSTTAANANLTYSTSAQNTSLSATVTSTSGTVNTGTVAFTVFNGGTPVGAAVTSGTVSSGSASATYTLPSGSGAGAYSIQAVYNASAPFATSSDTTHSLTVGQATATVTLGSLAQNYSGSPLSATATTSPAGLTVNFTYNGSSTAPTAAGSYPVVGTISDPNYTGTATGTLVISKIAAKVTLGNLAQSYSGSPLSATATTSPAGLTVNFTYNGSSTAPTAAGSYSVVGAISDPNYTGTATGTLVISKIAATVTLGSLAQSYSGSPLSATATTSPAGLTVNLTYNGSSTAPTAAGSYSVVGAISDANYTGTATGTLVISKTAATITLGSLAQSYSGSPLSATATTNPAGLTVNFTYNGSSTAPTAAGSYSVVGAISDANYTGTATGTLVISKTAATITLGSLAQSYSGSPLSATATTNPTGLTVNFTYNGSSTAPTAAGSYSVVGAISDANYTGTATGTLIISRIASAVSLTSSVSPVLITNSITLTATVSITAGAPTGSVSFLDGTTLIGQGTLIGDVATLTTSSLSVGSHSITATYSGDTNFAASTSSALTELVLDFAVSTPTSGSGDGASQTISSGGTATYSLDIAPSSGTSFPTPATLTLTGLPAGAVAVVTPSTWTQLTGNSWSLPANVVLTPVTVSIQMPSQTARLEHNELHNGKLPYMILGLLLLPFAGRFRRVGKRLGGVLSVLVLLVVAVTAMAGLSGCGAAKKSSPQPQSYTITATVTSGALSHSTTITLAVN
jgi:sugar lactone lactonase YvrE